MNEVTKVHLGRQAFVIAVDAHRELRHYLDAIKKEVGDQDVIDEIEMRMAEILTEHGVTGDKVVLSDDVDMLKQQLGDPKDFHEGDDDRHAEPKPPDNGKRLYRDTDNGMVAGVAAGLANYFGVDAVVVRILFVLAILSGGWGIVVYLVLWLLVPEAKTSSDRLKMAGKPITIDSLKEVVDRADVKGTAKRASTTVGNAINTFFRVVLKLIGLGLIVTGLSMLLALIASAIYFWINGGTPLQNAIFPIGLKEHLLLYMAGVISGLMSLFIVLFGVAIYLRKWPIRVWVTGVLAGLLFTSCAVGGALAADTFPTIRDRYQANVHSTVQQVEPFQTINLVGGNVDVDYHYASTYSVELKYFDHPDVSKIKISEDSGTLTVDSSDFDGNRHCHGWCIPDIYTVRVIISGPTIDSVFQKDLPDSPAMPDEPFQIR